MHIGMWLLVKHNGQVQRGIVQEFSSEDLQIKLDNGELISRKYWEVRAMPLEDKNEKNN